MTDLQTAACSGAAADEADEFVYLGVFETSIVGIQHYRGLVNKDESLVLERQPSNPYDKNAIRVLNTSLEQVGHIPKETAAVLAPLLDADQLMLEAKTGKNVAATYKIRISVTAYVSPTESSRIETLLKRSYGSDSRSLDTAPPIDSLAKGGRLPAEQFESRLVGIFSSMSRPEELEPKDPTDRFVGSLMPYQRYGLAWMLRREEERIMPFTDRTNTTLAGPLVRTVTRKRSRSTQSTLSQIHESAEDERAEAEPFWVKLKEKDGKEKYVNVLTNHATFTPPTCAKGGILADDMGLGKTIQTLALLSHPVTAASSSLVQSRKSLIVCPLSLMTHWQSHMEGYLPGTPVLIFYGIDRKTSSLADLARGGVVITTYGVLRSSISALKTIVWDRVILDEAHCIKSATTANAKAAQELQARCRWCLTGTPLQNHLDDLQSLIAFLKMDPFDNIQWWRALVSRPLRARQAEAINRLRSVVASICLRRTKEMLFDGKPLVELPPLKVDLVKLELSNEEQVFYSRIKDACSARFKAWERENKTEKMMAHALVMLLRLRQLCGDRRLVPNIDADFGTSLISSTSEGGQEMTVSDAEAQLLVAADDTCAICLEQISCAAVTKCRHVFCKSCIELLLRGDTETQSSRCPLCRSELVIVKECVPETSALLTVQGKPSTKITAVVELVLDAIRSKEKIVVFSQWPSMLDLVKEALREKLQSLDLRSISLDGRMSLSQRSQALSAFRDDAAVPVLLLSTMAGGTGLNLTVATRCVLVDPWWNPSIDRQAMMRIHRIGQTKPVTVTRIVMANTVESMILDLQAKKNVVSEGALGRGAADSGSGKLTMEDLRRFF